MRRTSERLDALEDVLGRQACAEIRRRWDAMEGIDAQAFGFDQIYKFAHSESRANVFNAEYFERNLYGFAAFAATNGPEEERLPLVAWSDAMLRTAGLLPVPDPDPLTPRQRAQLEALAREVPSLADGSEDGLGEYVDLLDLEDPSWFERYSKGVSDGQAA